MSPFFLDITRLISLKEDENRDTDFTPVKTNKNRSLVSFLLSFCVCVWDLKSGGGGFCLCEQLNVETFSRPIKKVLSGRRNQKILKKILEVWGLP